MISLNVSLNGKRFCVAGVPETGVVSATVCWVRRTQAQIKDCPAEEMFLEVAGLNAQDHLRWPGCKELKTGDEIRIKVVETGRISPSVTRKVESPADRVRAEKLYVRRMAKKFGWKIVS